MPRSQVVRPLFTTILLLAAILYPAVYAQELLDCPNSDTGRTSLYRTSETQQLETKDPIQIRADRVDMQLDHEARFIGNVELLRIGQSILANELTYSKPNNTANASGDVTLKNENGDRFESNRLFLQLDDRSGYSDKSRYFLSGLGRGEAQRIRFKRGNELDMDKVSYTTCPEGNNDWYMNVRRLELDRDKDIGKAYHATVVFKRVPIFYWPYMDFPLSGRRKTGFLAPELGNSDKSGTTFATPFYWNIAPQMDDTLTPRFYSKRGLQLHNEFRYLGRRFSGELELEYLPDDNEFDDDRSAAAWQHRQRFGQHWSTQADLKWVSDGDYLDDFGDSLSIASQTHLPETVTLDYNGRLMRFSARAFGFQTVDENVATTDKPYGVLPELRLYLTTPQERNRLHLALNNEWSRFYRDDSVVANRALIEPKLSWPLRNNYGFFIPQAGARYVSYDHSDTPASIQAITPGFDDQRSQHFAYYSLDTGLVFERASRWFGDYIQTLEPRVFYLYSPFRAQDDLEVFDTNVPDTNINEFFRNNRFVGGDRFGDANQVTAALSTRVLDTASGVERWHATIGQIYYFQDREVTLPGEPVQTSNSSDIIAEAGALLRNQWFARGAVQWDHDLGQAQKVSLTLQYQPGKDRIINLGYNLVRDQGTPANEKQRQTDVSMQWPLGQRWGLRGRWHYSLEDSTNLESYAGLEYRSCCWALRLFSSRRLSSSGEQVNSSMLQLELTGLANLGDVPQSPLRQSVFYDAPED